MTDAFSAADVLLDRAYNGCHDFVAVGLIEFIMPNAVTQRTPSTEPRSQSATQSGHGSNLAAVLRVLCGCAIVGSAVVTPSTVAAQQTAPSGWQTGIDKAFSLTPAPAAPAPSAPAAAQPIPAGQGQVRLKALLTDDGQSIDQGLVWRIFADKPGTDKTLVATPTEGDSRARLVATHREASPQIRLPIGDYIVNAGFGRASLTRRMTVKSGDNGIEKFVVNAGGLRLYALVGNSETPAPNTVAYDIYSDERDQYGQRSKVLSGTKPGLIIRLNSGIYHLVSTYGDANARVELDVTVEPGKLTEATIAHAAGKATFKLVQRVGGDALTDTQWNIMTPQGELIKESVGALPTHTLIPGAYVVTAKQGGKTYRREFKVMHGGMTQVEVMRQ
jgi:hypothetical protein